MKRIEERYIIGKNYPHNQHFNTPNIYNSK